MHHVILQVDGRTLPAVLEAMRTLGVTRAIFPAHEYRPKPGAGNARKSIYDTAPILPRGDDGGFAERFLNDRRRSRDT